MSNGLLLFFRFVGRGSECRFRLDSSSLRYKSRNLRAVDSGTECPSSFLKCHAAAVGPGIPSDVGSLLARVGVVLLHLLLVLPLDCLDLPVTRSYLLFGNTGIVG